MGRETGVPPMEHILPRDQRERGTEDRPWSVTPCRLLLVPSLLFTRDLNTGRGFKEGHPTENYRERGLTCRGQNCREKCLTERRSKTMEEGEDGKFGFRPVS